MPSSYNSYNSFNLRFDKRLCADEINWKDIWGRYHTGSIQEHDRCRKLESRFIKITQLKDAIHSRR